MLLLLTDRNNKINNKKPADFSAGYFLGGGEEEIRTLGTLLTYTRFPIVLLRPTRTPLRVVKTCSL